VPKKDFEIVTGPAKQQQPGASLACHLPIVPRNRRRPPGRTRSPDDWFDSAARPHRPLLVEAPVLGEPPISYAAWVLCRCKGECTCSYNL
jgi:hypothetical protein